MTSNFEDALRGSRPSAMPSPEATAAARSAALAAFAKATEEELSLRRRRLPRRRAALVAAVMVIALAGPAYALVHGVIDFSHAEQAPPVVQKQFSELFGDDAPPGMNPHVLPLSTRKVAEYRLDGKRYVLWVAPTQGGGFCEDFTGFAGGCVATRDTPTGFPPLATTEIRPWLIDVMTQAGAVGAALIGGHVLTNGIFELELVYQDGDHTDLPVTWVSAPIDAGFFLYSIPADHRTPGHVAATLIARDANGEVLAQTSQQLDGNVLAPR